MGIETNLKIYAEEGIKNYFNNQKEYHSDLLTSLFPVITVNQNKEGNGVTEHSGRFYQISVADEPTMTSGRATELKTGALSSGNERFKINLYGSKLEISIQQIDNPGIENDMKTMLEYMGSLDYVNMGLYGALGKRPLGLTDDQIKNSGLKGGLLNYVGRTEKDGEIKTLDDFMNFIISALIDLSALDRYAIKSKAPEKKPWKKYTVVVPRSSGLEEMEFLRGINNPVKVIDYLRDVKSIDLVTVPDGVISSVAILPYKKELLYFHTNTWSKFHQFSFHGGKTYIEYFYKSAGLCIAQPEVLITKKITKERLTGGLGWKGNQIDVNITNKPLETKDVGKGEQPVEESVPSQKSTPKTQGQNK